MEIGWHFNAKGHSEMDVIVVIYGRIHIYTSDNLQQDDICYSRDLINHTSDKVIRY